MQYMLTTIPTTYTHAHPCALPTSIHCTHVGMHIIWTDTHAEEHNETHYTSGPTRVQSLTSSHIKGIFTSNANWMHGCMMVQMQACVWMLLGVFVSMFCVLLLVYVCMYVRMYVCMYESVYFVDVLRVCSSVSTFAIFTSYSFGFAISYSLVDKHWQRVILLPVIIYFHFLTVYQLIAFSPLFTYKQVNQLLKHTYIGGWMQFLNLQLLMLQLINTITCFEVPVWSLWTSTHPLCITCQSFTIQNLTPWLKLMKCTKAVLGMKIMQTTFSINCLSVDASCFIMAIVKAWLCM